MIKELRLHNWKSFEDTVVYIDPLTFLIGVNASGKSNVLDALKLLRNLSRGATLEDAINGIRGKEDWLIRRGAFSTKIGILMCDGHYDYLYEVDIAKDQNGFKFLENDIFVSPVGEDCHFDVDSRNYDVTTSIHLNVDSRCVGLDGNRIIETVIVQLRNIVILDPKPEQMRYYSKPSREINEDGGNTAGVLAALSDKEKHEVEELLTAYIKPLPERDINGIESKTFGISNSDAMLVCYEDWNPGTPVDARGMSDGTLRFCAIVVALLTVKPGSLLLIEEVDNGLHPSRAKELVKVLREISTKRNVDVLCTTHNPVLIDELGSDMLPFISYIRRDDEGNSHVELLENKENLAKLIASSSIGEMMIRDVL